MSEPALPVISQIVYDTLRPAFSTDEAWQEFLNEGWERLKQENPLLAQFINEQLREFVPSIFEAPNARNVVMATLALLAHQMNSMNVGQSTIWSGKTPFRK